MRMARCSSQTAGVKGGISLSAIGVVSATFVDRGLHASKSVNMANRITGDSLGL